jgi:hypothetical protein
MNREMVIERLRGLSAFPVRFHELVPPTSPPTGSSIYAALCLQSRSLPDKSAHGAAAGTAAPQP